MIALLEIHASPNISNHTEQTPAELALSLGMANGSDIIRMLHLEEVVRLEVLAANRASAKSPGSSAGISEFVTSDSTLQKKRWSLHNDS